MAIQRTKVVADSANQQRKDFEGPERRQHRLDEAESVQQDVESMKPIVIGVGPVMRLDLAQEFQQLRFWNQRFIDAR